MRINWPVELHPMLVHFPIALLCFAFLLDGAAWLWRSQPARMAGLYALAAGAFMTALAVVSGLITPEAREREGRRLAEGSFSLNRFFSGRLVEVHKHWSYVLLALVVLWLIVRVASHIRSSRWHGLSMAIGVLALIALVLTGYYGGDLVYGRRARERGQVVLPRAASQGIAAAEAAARLGAVDLGFLTQAGNMGNSQAALAGLAARKSVNPAVGRYAQQLVADHAVIERQLQAVAPVIGVTLPRRLDGPATRELSPLSALSGSRFDREFLRFETLDFRFHAEQFNLEIAQGTNPDLRRFARTVAPAIARHYRTAEALGSNE